MDSGKRRIYTKASGKLGKGIRKMKEITKDIIRELILVYPALTPCQKDILTATELLIGSYENGGKLLVCGNGGSAADSLHIVGELMKSFCNKRILPKENRKKLSEYGEDGKRLADSLQGALPAVSLINESSLSTAFLNDVNPEMVFAQQVFGLGKKGRYSSRNKHLRKREKRSLCLNSCKIERTSCAFVNRKRRRLNETDFRRNHYCPGIRDI